MTSFKIINDDVGLRGVQEGNKTPVISGPVTSVKASTPLQKSPENLPLKSPHAERNNSEASHEQRRHTDRRKTDKHLLLETRNQHDRRTKTEKMNDNDDIVSTLHGVDEFV